MVKSDKCMGVSQLLGGTFPAKVCAYVLKACCSSNDFGVMWFKKKFFIQPFHNV